MKTVNVLMAALSAAAIAVLAYSSVQYSRTDERVKDLKSRYSRLKHEKSILDDIPVVIVDTECRPHKIKGDFSRLHNAQLLEDVEGHALVFSVDESGIGSFVHISPCNRCAEVEFYNSRKLEPTRLHIGN